MAVDADYAQWLSTGQRTAAATDPVLAARWGATAATTALLSPLATQAGARAEASRQLAFLGAPVAVEQLVVPGLRRDLLGRPCLDGDRVVFVIGIDEGDDGGPETTVLTVLRRLG